MIIDCIGHHRSFCKTLSVVAFFCVAIIIPFAEVAAQKASPESKYLYFSKHNRISTDIFAQGREFAQVLLSPDGRHIFYAFPTGDDLIMSVEPMDEEVAGENYFVGRVPMMRYGGAHWVSNERIIVQINSILFNFNQRSRARGIGAFLTLQKSLLAFNVNSNEIDRLMTSDAINPALFTNDLVLDPLIEDNENILVSITEEEENYPSVYKMNVYTGDIEKVVERRENILNWVTDFDGEVRFGFGSNEGGLVMITKAIGSNEWINLRDQDLFKDDSFFPINFSFNKNSLFVRSAVANGRFSIYDFDLDQGVLTEKLFEHPMVDATGIELSSGNKKLLAVTYHEDKLQRQFFDPEYERLMNSINLALPMRNNYLEDMTQNGQYLLIRSDSDVFPGAYYRMDVANKKLDLIGEFNSRLNPEYLSPQRKVTYFARDGLEVTAYLTIPKSARREDNLPVIVLPHSTVNGRDTNTYNNLVQFLASRGYAVFQPNYRGSSGYGLAYQMMGYGEWGGNIQNDITDGIQYLISSGIADKDRICITGSGFAGYAALLATFQTPELYKCAAALAPITDLTNYAKVVRRSYGKVVQQRMFGDRKTSEIRKISPVHNVKNIQVPILLVRGEIDQSYFSRSIEPHAETEDFVKKLNKANKDISYVKVVDETDEFKLVKSVMFYMEELEAFFAKHLGAPEETETIKYVSN